MSNLAKAVEQTANRKVGNVSVTMASQGSCPLTCPFLKNGCYAESGLQGIHTARMNAFKATPLQIARAEATEIRKLSGMRPLRLHVVGDCITDRTAEIVSRAATETVQQPIWTYTHAWRSVKRQSWGSVNVLASVESTEQALQAIERGYAPAMTIASHPQDGKAYVKNGLRLIPCPEQTRGIQCDKCKLCWDDQSLLRRKAVITFAAHGSGAKRVKAAIE